MPPKRKASSVSSNSTCASSARSADSKRMKIVIDGMEFQLKNDGTPDKRCKNHKILQAKLDAGYRIDFARFGRSSLPPAPVVTALRPTTRGNSLPAAFVNRNTSEESRQSSENSRERIHTQSSTSSARSSQQCASNNDKSKFEKATTESRQPPDENSAVGMRTRSSVSASSNRSSRTLRSDSSEDRSREVSDKQHSYENVREGVQTRSSTSSAISSQQSTSSNDTPKFEKAMTETRQPPDDNAAVGIRTRSSVSASSNRSSRTHTRNSNESKSKSREVSNEPPASENIGAGVQTRSSTSSTISSKQSTGSNIKPKLEKATTDTRQSSDESAREGMRTKSSASSSRSSRTLIRSHSYEDRSMEVQNEPHSSENVNERVQTRSSKSVSKSSRRISSSSSDENKSEVVLNGHLPPSEDVPKGVQTTTTTRASTSASSVPILSIHVSAEEHSPEIDPATIRLTKKGEPDKRFTTTKNNCLGSIDDLTRILNFIQPAQDDFEKGLGLDSQNDMEVSSSSVEDRGLNTVFLMNSQMTDQDLSFSETSAFTYSDSLQLSITKEEPLISDDSGTMTSTSLECTPQSDKAAVSPRKILKSSVSKIANSVTCNKVHPPVADNFLQENTSVVPPKATAILPLKRKLPPVGMHRIRNQQKLTNKHSDFSHFFHDNQKRPVPCPPFLLLGNAAEMMRTSYNSGSSWDSSASDTKNPLSDKHFKIPTYIPKLDYDTIRCTTGNFRKENVLGKGGFGTVYRGYLRGNEVAVKKLPEQSVTSPSTQRAFVNELKILAQLGDHPNLVMLYGYTHTPDPPTLVTEFVQLGSLDKLLHHCQDDYVKANICDGRIKKKIVFGIVNGMRQLHSSGVVHMDLKPANILITADYSVKIADFGLSRIQETYGIYSQRVTTPAGTLAYMAPELLHDPNIINTSIDVYAFGIVLNEIIHEEEPYLGEEEDGNSELMLRRVNHGYRPHVDHKLLPDNLYNLTSSCWSTSPYRRPSFHDIAEILKKEDFIFPGLTMN